MATKNVFIVSSSLQNKRPEIDFEDDAISEATDWMLVGDILSGEVSAKKYSEVKLKLRARDACKWDFYRCGSALGLISQKAADVLRKSAAKSFALLPASINGSPYYFLRVKGSIDCLDKKKSEIVPFRSDPKAIQWIEKYVFRKKQLVDPSLFVIPEGIWHLLATDGVRGLIEAHKLKGFRLRDAETEAEVLMT